MVLGIAHDITERRKAEDRLKDEFQHRLRSRDAIIQAISSLIDMRDPYTSGHQQRVAGLAQAIAVEMKLSPDDVDILHIASLIHDLGKISVPSEILTKPGRLEDEELQLIREHPATGYAILKSIDLPDRVAEIVYQHHEKDGRIRISERARRPGDPPGSQDPERRRDRGRHALRTGLTGRR